ncbi:hypothetical protein CERZMDRAFT_97498 [Cercospora zeae-maydis SCOH1-5]|uniref:Uncharacterized protein n=1 Tax=Cercospora zeae-maydis SCOH1-5 TaxID=717836 RepID=A0A6A6FG54_9PEZI|nr:hypothetical protein CERZMDRAFT_97498 [Cercospora zeae-maydis SCOH1-5]
MTNSKKTPPSRTFRSTPPKVGLEQGLELEQIGIVSTNNLTSTFTKQHTHTHTQQDTYRNKQLPWTWPNSPVVPGGILAALAANAAWNTLTPNPSDFAIDVLQIHFLSGPSPNLPMQLHVQRLNDTGRFATRLITTTQSHKPISHVTCSFIRLSAFGGPQISHSPSRKTSDKITHITLDDLDEGRNDMGPWLRYQRLSLTNDKSPSSSPEDSPPEDLVHTFAGTVFPSIQTSSSTRVHALGIIALSDFHVLNCPAIVHGLSLGQPALGDESRTPKETDFERYTSLNHTVNFHRHEGFRADELKYVEARSPWSGKRRGYVETRIFDGEGEGEGALIATCTQETYYVLKRGVRRGKL